ncbi:MAG: hypothetical protein H5T69_08480 [Chloroflexi bacterium]|nr:hypothetical protein [Chloroflexota bacterium]
MNANIAWLPLLGVALFAAFAWSLHRLGGKLGASGPHTPGKYLPYACGEDLPRRETRLSYQRFFRLALMFIVVHMATLVIALLPMTLDTRLVAALYLAGVAICVDILERR